MKKKPKLPKPVLAWAHVVDDDGLWFASIHKNLPECAWKRAMGEQQ